VLPSSLVYVAAGLAESRFRSDSHQGESSRWKNDYIPGGIKCTKSVECKHTDGTGFQSALWELSGLQARVTGTVTLWFGLIKSDHSDLI
jgi:hypothetical protein